jgi:hypothetical protein
MLTPKFGGIFDCRKYDQSGKLAHDQRQLLADTDNVTFSALIPIDQVPEIFVTNGAFDEFARPKASKREREAAQAENREPMCDVLSVKFKIGANARWFDASAQPMKRPTNAELEANRYKVQIDFTRKEKDPAQPLKPSGYWVNNIMISKVESNPFVGQAFEQAAATAAELIADAPFEDEDDGDGLPFD